MLIWVFLIAAAVVLVWRVASPSSQWRVLRRVLHQETDPEPLSPATQARSRVNGMLGLVVLMFLVVFYAAGGMSD